MPARSVCLVTLSLSEAGPGRFGRQVSVTDIYHTIPYHTSTSTRPLPYHTIPYRTIPCVESVSDDAFPTKHAPLEAALALQRLHCPFVYMPSEIDGSASGPWATLIVASSNGDAPSVMDTAWAIKSGPPHGTRLWRVPENSEMRQRATKQSKQRSRLPYPSTPHRQQVRHWLSFCRAVFQR